MNKKMYIRGMAGQVWYNFTEIFALALLHRPTPKGVTYEKKVPYGKEKNNHINIYYRDDLKNKKKPLFIYIHGGGFISGLISMRNPYVAHWAKLGFHTFSINYSFAPQKVFPTQLQEVFSAIDYIYDRAEEYNIDTENVVIAGESAGGYFISYIASCINNWERLQKLGITFRHKEDLKLKALVSHSGCFSVERLTDKTKEQSKFPDIKMMTSSFIGKSIDEIREYIKTDEGKLLSPEITASFPPSYLVWCTRDKLRYEAFDMQKELEALCVDHKLFKADGIIGNHAWSIAMPLKKSKICLKDTWDFTLPYVSDYFEKQNGEWKFKTL